MKNIHLTKRFIRLWIQAVIVLNVWNGYFSYGNFLEHLDEIIAAWNMKDVDTRYNKI